MEQKFEGTGRGNEILKVNDTCFVSFNKSPGMDISMWSADNNSSETAIVITIDGQKVYKILNGDFRSECLNIVNEGKGEKELLELYQKNQDKHSSWSNK